MRPILLSLLALSLAAGCAPAEGEAGDDIDIVRGALTSGAVKINCGGTAAGWGWIADDDYTGTTGTIGTVSNIIKSDDDVVGTAPNIVYQTGRYTTSTMAYTLPGFDKASVNVVRLHFAETNWTTKGQRLFDVVINGKKVLSAFDIIAAAGAPNARVIREFTLPPNDQGQYVIAFSAIKNAAMINGIEVVAAATAPVQRIRAGAVVGLGAFAADQGYSGTTSTVTRLHGIVLNKSLHTAPAELYQSQRYGDDFTYKVSGLRPSSANVVRLHFCDTHFSGVGQRKFNVAIQDVPVLTNLDLVAAGGFDTAVVRELKATADGAGEIKIHFTKVVDKATISGIEVLQTVPWAMKKDMTSAEYQTEFDLRLAQGYRPKYVAGYTVNGAQKFLGVWELGSYAVTEAHDVTALQMQQLLVDRKNQGWVLTLLNGYAVGTGSRYIAIWEQKPAPTASFARIDMTLADAQAEAQTQIAAGKREVHLSGYTIGGSERYAAIYETRPSSPPWVTRFGMSLTQLLADSTAHKANGDRLVDITAYFVGLTARYTTIWEQGTGTPMAYQYAVNATQFPLEWDDLYHQGYRPLTVLPYAPTSGSESYVGIWDNPLWSDNDLGSIDAAVAQIRKGGGEIADTVPSTSIAIAKDGRLVFSKAFGSATLGSPMAKPIPAHAASVYRIGSISKPILSAAMNTLIERGLVNLNSKVFGPGSIMGTTYGTQPYKAQIPLITVGQMLRHTSGWYEPVPVTSGEPVRNEVDWGVDNYPLTRDSGGGVMVPVTAGGQWVYANGNYITLARVVETLTNQPFNTRTYGDWVRTNVLQPMGITTMQVGATKQSDPKPNEVTYYSPTPNAAYTDPMPEMDGSGGWIASATDLVQFALRFDGSPTVPDVLSPATITLMQKPCLPGVMYGLGWDTDGQGNVAHNGILASAAGQLRILPGGVVYAGLANWFFHPGFIDGPMKELVTSGNNGRGVLKYPWVDLSPAYNSL